ncbi:(-)-germacrene D synthase-like [Punica granatum]|uniref:(-)-germacrene D synthase-like n=1 Tax=Punica granatum TaxID=22663 RepID=A0A6P8CHS7_PUNGR|nr:(-)-germacrene D synthase-like [Punica granatum]
MSIEDSLPSTLTSAQTGATHVVGRRSAGFHPSVWGDYFLNYTSGSMITDVRAEQHREKLKMEVKRMLTDADDDFDKSSDNKLYLIDQIQRLGIGYQFGREIAEVLEQIHSWYSNRDHADYADDLCTAARMFRLLRQQGFRISCDIFDKFKDSNGEFSESLVKDVRGLLSLYEASHFRVNGEDILEEALSFTIHHLRSAVEIDDPKLNRNLVTEVKHALKRSLRKGLVRLDAWHYIKLYEEDASHSEVLLELAKLDFNCLQKFHQKELSEITRWWKDCLDVERNFPYIRDRVTENYFWILGVYFEPEFSLPRMMLAKVISLLSIMDDTYDVFGTPKELQLFTDAIDRWDIGAIDELPQYMQIFYKALLDTYEEFEKTLAKQGRTYRLFYAKEAMKNQAKVYFKEATWFHQNYTPTLEEYMPLAMETTAYGMLATASFLGMGDVASKDAFEWLLSDPKILRGSMIVCRLMDDIVSHKFEQKRGHVASAIECYMKHHGATEQETEEKLWKMIDDGWKDINEECLHPTPVPMPLLTRIVNFTCVIEVLYKDKDRYTNSQTDLKDYVTALLVDPIPL